MSERRPFPPSPRRLALARQAGLTAASPLVVGALAAGAAILAAVFLARAAAQMIGSWIADACRAADGSAAASFATSGGTADSAIANTGVATSDSVIASIGDIGTRVLELAAPIAGIAALAALVAHVAQTRSLWLPRRRLTDAPVVEPARVRRSAFDIAGAIAIGVVAFGWLWTTAPRLAALVVVRDPLPAVAAALASLLAALAIAWLAIGILDALVRHAELARALAMTATEKREDDRLAAADPRWRAQRLSLARTPSASTAVARASLLLLGDDLAVAIAWDPRRQPVPVRTITGRRARATQLLGLARRHRVAVHRDAQLAAALVDGDGPVPDAHWARLAEIIAAVQGAHRGRDVTR